MSSDLPSPPTLDEFIATCRKSLAYLDRYGFKERPNAEHRPGNRFEVWFCAGDRTIGVVGEGYGTAASIHLEHRSGVGLGAGLLVPPEERRPRRSHKDRKMGASQLDQIREAAERLLAYGEDFLRGDLARFFKLADPLPPYLRRPFRGD